MYCSHKCKLFKFLFTLFRLQ